MECLIFLEISCETDIDYLADSCHFAFGTPVCQTPRQNLFSCSKCDFSVFKQLGKVEKRFSDISSPVSREKALSRELQTRQLVPGSPPRSHALCLYQQNLTLVLTISFPVLIKSALLLVGNVMEKMTVGIILMKMDVVSKNYFKIFSDEVEPG